MFKAKSALIAAPMAAFLALKQKEQKGQNCEQRIKNQLHAAVANIPHKKKLLKGGEDAFICTDELVAVADGVGGWANKGVEVAFFSREFCFLVKDLYFR